jgi:hypothetical protein
MENANMTIRITERYEDDGTRVESGFVDDADIDAVGPLMLRAAAFAAAPEFVAADLADRQKDRDFYEKRIDAIRLRQIGYERDGGK